MGFREGCVVIFWRRAFVAMVAILTIGTAAEGAPLDLTSQAWDILASNLSVTITPTSFDAEGIAALDALPGLGDTFTLDDGTFDFPDVQDARYLIHASLNGAGALTSGTLTIKGSISGLGIPYGTLLEANLTTMGFNDGPHDTTGIFEFLGDVTGGLGQFGPHIGVILQAFDLPDGWTIPSVTTFEGFGSSDNFTFARAYVPEPSALVILAVSVGAIGLITRRRVRKTDR
jgi:hypothetical protein